ncbi:unnamed protein product [Microthlaspi erraticum]|uniref:Glycoside hydrolase family 3 C-terminal domain-containing protein n=1 Tax=Microthlaspi erraticum TaxID=1685480 RepID=A0A6D2IFZ7_9BRAS|nr:unnamed protein product [Microthlaspi erraticum]
MLSDQLSDHVFMSMGFGVQVCKDPRWGRCFESYSEDTDGVCNITSFVFGLQGTPPQGHPAGYPFVAGRQNVVACAKHFVGDGDDRSLLKFVGCKEHREIAHEAVRKSLVLLKNGRDSQKPFLQLDRNAKKVLVAGTHANNLGFQCGGWTKTWQGTTLLESLERKRKWFTRNPPSEETLTSNDFCYAIVAFGAPYAESRGDDPEPSIHFDGAEVVRLVAEKVPTVVILMTGRLVVLDPTVLEKVEALVAAWLPGTEGDGITDVVFADIGLEMF